MSFELLDCFCGVGAWASKDPILPYTVDDIIAQMDRFGVSRALVCNNRTRMLSRPDDCNRALPGMIGNSKRLIPAFALALNPYAPDNGADACFSQMRDVGARALWLNTPGVGRKLSHSLATWQLSDWLQRCSDTRLPVLLYVESLAPDVIHALCSEYPALRLILTGVMYSSDSFLYPLLRAHANLRVCLGHMYIPSGNPMRFVEHFGHERLLFGSGLPDFSPGGMITHVTYADISEAAKAAILGGNLQQLLDEVQL